MVLQIGKYTTSNFLKLSSSNQSSAFPLWHRQQEKTFSVCKVLWAGDNTDQNGGLYPILGA